MNTLRFLLLWLLVGAFLASTPIQAQAPETTTVAPPPAAIDPGPEDALNRGTPRGSIIGYLEACELFDFDKAAEYLDLRQLPEEVEELGGPELARQLNHVLSRAVWLDDYTVSASPEGVKGDGLPDYRDELVVIRAEVGEVPIWLQHVPRGDGEKIWKVSNRSVALIPELYDEFSYPPGVETVRSWFPENASLLGVEAFKWFIILVIALLGWPVFYLLGILLTRLFSSPVNPTYPLFRKIMAGPFVAVGVLFLSGSTLNRLGVGAKAQQVLEAKTLVTLVLVWALWSVINLIKKHQQDKLDARGRPGAAKLMQPMTTFAKLLILLMGVLFWLNNMGINVTTLIAGLGVGGLALALALQKPLEDMMGALSIFSQAPMRVGDFCRYGAITGTVEDIGLRTTRFRTLEDTLISIPNARISIVEIENFSARSRIRYTPTLRLRYDTSSGQIREIMSKIHEMLQQNEKVHDEPLRVRFTDFDDDAILIKVNSYLKTTDYAEALEFGEEINLDIMDIVESAGVAFALPGRSIYTEGDNPSPAL